MHSNELQKLSKKELIKKIEFLSGANDNRTPSQKIEIQFDSIVELFPQAILIINPNSQLFVVANKKAEILFGYSKEEFLKLSPVDISPEFQESGRKTFELFQEKIQHMKHSKGATFEWTHINKNKEIIPCEIHLLRLFNSSKNLVFANVIDIRERKKANNLLLKSEEQLRLALAAANLGTWDWEIPENKITWSENVYQIFGLEKEKFKGTIEEYQRLIILEDLPKVTNAIDISLNGDAEYFIQHRILTSNSEIKWLEGKGRVYRDSEGKPIRMLGTVVDITEGKLAEENLKSSEERFELFYKFASEAIIIIQANEKRIIDSNHTFERLFEYPREEGLSFFSEKLMTKESWDKIQLVFTRKKSEYTSEIICRKKNNAFFPAILKMNLYFDKGIEKYVISFLDISTAREAEELKIVNKEIILQNEMIEKQKNELETVIENLKRTQSKLIQSEKMASLGQLISGIAHEINNPIGAIQASRQNLEDCINESKTLFLEIVKILNEIGHKDSALFLDLIHEGAINKKQLIGMEERKRKKEILILLKELGLSEEIQDLLVDIGITDLNTYMPILASPNAKVLLNYAAQEVFSIRSIKTIQIAVDRCSKIIFALKNFSHFETKTEKTRCKISENLETVFTIYANKLKSVELIKNYENVPDIYCYPDDLLHVWTNLLYNSLQAMKFRGELKVEIKKEENNLLVAITDSGAGIAPEIRAKIFDPFFTTKPLGEGSGLGLDIVKKIIEKHKGQITLSSKPGQTTFNVYLPIEIEN